MPIYKFYRIVPKDATKTDCYIGHTVQPLRKRFKGHYDRMNRVGSGSCSSAILFRNYGKDALEIVLIHELELPDKEYARREERRLYEEHRERAVNQVRPWRSEEERKEADNAKQKQYHSTHREAQCARMKQYYDTNRERVKQMGKERYARESALKYLRILLE